MAAGTPVHPAPLARASESSWRDAADLAAAGIAPRECPDGPTVPVAGGGPCIPARYIAACSNGIAIPAPYISEGLVRDCALLLDGKDACAGRRPSTGMGGRGHRDERRPSARDPHLPPQQGLRGVIPPQLGYLTELAHLHLGANNHLTGPIPPELDLTKLVSFFAGGSTG